MANPERGQVALTVEDRTYTLILDMNALCELEELLSTPSQAVTAAQAFVAAANLSYRHVRALVWAALRRHHPDLTLSAVGDLIEAAGGPEQLFETLKRVREASDPDPVARPRKARRSKAGGPTTSTPGGSESTAKRSGG
jgi:hypothetical protein